MLAVNFLMTLLGGEEASSSVVLWQAFGLLVGSIVAAVTALSVLAKIPGGRWLFQRLVSDPAEEVVREVVDEEIRVAVERSVETHISEKLKPIESKIDQINHAVNNVGPGAPPLKSRVGKLEQGQEAMHRQLSSMDGKIEVTIDMLKELVGRGDG